MATIPIGQKQRHANMGQKTGISLGRRDSTSAETTSANPLGWLQIDFVDLPFLINSISSLGSRPYTKYPINRNHDQTRITLRCAAGVSSAIITHILPCKLFTQYMSNIRLGRNIICNMRRFNNTIVRITQFLICCDSQPASSSSDLLPRKYTMESGIAKNEMRF